MTASATRWVKHDFGGRSSPGYFVLNLTIHFQVVDHDLKTFSEAQAYCAAEGGTLAMPKTDQQQDFIEILMQQSHSETFWIGLDDLETEKVHKWADGTLLDYANGAYNRYLKGHPDKMYQTEDCVENVSRVDIQRSALLNHVIRSNRVAVFTGTMKTAPRSIPSFVRRSTPCPDASTQTAKSREMSMLIMTRY